MDVNRRNLMKGILGGGTLATFGIPNLTTAGMAKAMGPASDTMKTRTCALLLGSTPADDAFARGASIAHSTCSMRHENTPLEIATLEVIKLKGGLLREVERVSELMAVSRGMRWVAVMDDASAAVFTEIVRNAGGHLIARGTHVSSEDASAYPAFRDDSSPALRHLWASVSPEQSPGPILASQLVGPHHNFSIVENFLRDARGGGEASGGYGFFTPAFRSYESPRALAMHLHCSGLSAPEGCGLLGWDTSQRWTEFSSPREGARAWAAPENGEAANWVEALSYAVTLAGLGIETTQDHCERRGFVHRAQQGEWHDAGEAIFSEERFTSFIVDV
jgi:hypothetical protein